MILLTEQDEVSEAERFNLNELLHRTTFDVKQQGYFERRIRNCVTLDELEEIEKQLYMNVIEDKDRIAMGLSYNQGDIKKALRLL